jgi:hypothetical protein
MDSTLAGGKPLLGGNQDVSAVDLVWVGGRRDPVPLSQFRAHTGLAAFQGVRGAAPAETRFSNQTLP